MGSEYSGGAGFGQALREAGERVVGRSGQTGQRRGAIPRPFDFAQGRLSASRRTIRTAVGHVRGGQSAYGGQGAHGYRETANERRLKLRPGIRRGRVSSDSACGYRGMTGWARPGCRKPNRLARLRLTRLSGCDIGRAIYLIFEIRDGGHGKTPHLDPLPQGARRKWGGDWAL